MKKKKAFTLAEVLITLGIIGIVAAMTMPTLTAKTRKAEATARLKKFYSVMNQAITMAENDYGFCGDWEYQMMDANDPDSVDLNYSVSEAFSKKYLIPYMKITNSGEKEWYRNENGNLKGYSITFPDGSVMNSKVGACIDISFDINGDKQPNTRGYDQFIFVLCNSKYSPLKNKKRCFSSYMPESTREENLQNCKDEPYYCSALLQWDNWEFKDDYPYKL